ncbi:MAG: hypothetical protein ACRBHB_18010, partial [Arenicella sp.]
MFSIDYKTAGEWNAAMKDNSFNHNRISKKDFEPIEMWPALKKPLIHESYPEEIKDAFIEVQKMASQGAMPAIIVSVCRSVIDVATKELASDLPGSTSLYNRID